jgi:hypothetical protein
MKRQVLTVILTLLAAVVTGATFLVALLRQFAMVEVAASILTMSQLYFLSSAIGDLMEQKAAPNRLRNYASLLLVSLLVVFYLVTRYWHGMGRVG